MAVLNIFRASCLARSSIAARASYMIRSAVDFLPRIIMMFTNFATRREPYLGSGSTSRLAEGGVRLLRRRRVDADADASLLRARLHRGRLRLLPRRLATPSH